MLTRKKLDKYRADWIDSHVAVGPLIIKLLDDIDLRIREIDRLTREVGRLHMESTDAQHRTDDGTAGS